MKKCKECGQEIKEEVWEVFSYQHNKWIRSSNVGRKLSKPIYGGDDYDYFTEKLAHLWFWRRKKR